MSRSTKNTNALRCSVFVLNKNFHEAKLPTLSNIFFVLSVAPAVYIVSPLVVALSEHTNEIKTQLYTIYV